MKEKNFYEIIKSFYNNEWDEITNKDKIKNFFIINRIFSIAYPLQANLFNHIKIEQSEVVDFWKIFISKKHKKLPNFIWTKTIKNQKDKNKNKYKEEVLNFIKEKYQISNREINDLIDFFPQKFDFFYKKIENIFK